MPVYSYSMLCSVFRLRVLGVRMPRPERPVDGHLSYQPHQVGSQSTMLARLAFKEGGGDQGGAVALPDLMDARVMRVTRNGIVIQGTEYIARGGHSKSNVSRYRQTWWCLVHTLNAAQSIGFGDLYEDDAMGDNAWDGGARRRA